MKFSEQTVQVLSQLDSADAAIWGLGICRSLDLKPGTVYPILRRLENEGLALAAWEPEPTGHKGPRRRFYQITPNGRAALHKFLRHKESRAISPISTTSLGSS